MRHVIPISGKDSLATALLQTAREPALHYEYIFNDAGAELPETYQWLDRVREKTGWDIQRIGEGLENRVEMRNGFLPSPRARFCTRLCKIAPTEKHLKGTPTKVYYGLRADEKRTGFVPVGSSQITPVYPLQEAQIDLRGVYSILDAQDLMPPAFEWARLRAAVESELNSRLFGDRQSTLSRAETLTLFAGRSRGNCYFCFFQRQYEWVWLYETHSEYFERAAAFEKDEYSWNQAFSLRELAASDEKRNLIFKRRVSQVVEYIERKRWNPQPLETDGEIALFSCGLLCGK